MSRCASSIRISRRTSILTFFEAIDFVVRKGFIFIDVLTLWFPHQQHEPHVCG